MSKFNPLKTFFFPLKSHLKSVVIVTVQEDHVFDLGIADQFEHQSLQKKKGQVSPPVKNRLNTKRKNPNSMSDFLRGPGIFSKWLNDLNLVTTMAWVLKYSLGLFHGYYISLGSWKKRFQGKSRFFNNLIWFHKLGWIFSMNIPLYSRRCCPSHHCLLVGKIRLKNCKYWPLRNEQKCLPVKNLEFQMAVFGLDLLGFEGWSENWFSFS